MFYELKNLKKNYDGRTVLDLKTLSVERSKILALMGPNGAGKTTLLEILAFLRVPTSGEFWFENKKVAFNSSQLTDLRRKVVLVQQQPILFTTTVAKNVEFPLRIRGTPKGEGDKIVEELLDLVGMGAFGQSRAHKLSGGETQRVAIARALACSPEVVLLDEPTANVDVENQIAIEDIIQEINRKRHISVIFTTHDTIQASRLADETLFLFEGKIAQSIYENIFSAPIERDEEGFHTCLLPKGLRLQVASEQTGLTRISIDPSGVKINRRRPDPLERNTLKGKLIQLTDEQSRVRALVDVGIPLSVLMPKEVFRGVHLGLGEEVWVTCPEESIKVFQP